MTTGIIPQGGIFVCRPKPISFSHDGFTQGITLISDCHIGARNIDYALLDKELSEAKQHGDRIALNGDVFDMILVGDRKRYRTGVMHPRLESVIHPVDKAIEWAAEIFGPYADLIDMIGIGNHEECFDARTEILTSQGWVLFSDLQGDEEIASYNYKTSEIRFARPIKMHSYDHTGSMVALNSRHIDLLVTPNHRILFKNPYLEDGWRLQEASKGIPNASIIPCAGYYKGSGVEFSDAQIKLAAWILTDVGYEVKVATLQRLVPDKNKLPAWLWRCDKRQFDIFLQRYVDGDGTRLKNSDSLTIYGRKHLLDDLQALCVINGYRTVMSKGNGNSVVLYVNQKEVVGFDKGVTSQVGYTGKVYCVTTVDDTVIIRRNGKAVITGNSVLRIHQTDVVKSLIRELRQKQTDSTHKIHYGGYCGFLDYKFRSTYGEDGHKRACRYVIFYHHGSGGAAPITKGMIDFSRKQWAIADCIWMGHKHNRLVSEIHTVSCPRTGDNVKVKPVRQIMTGAYFDTYVGQSQLSLEEHGRHTNYAADMGLAPQGKGGARLLFTILRDEIEAKVLQ